MNKKQKRAKYELPREAVLEISGVSDFGDYTAIISDKKNNPSEVSIYVAENRRLKPALSMGDKFLARLEKKKDCYIAKPIMRLGNDKIPDEIIYGVVEEKGDKFYLKSADKKDYMSYLLEDTIKIKDGDFVKVALSGGRSFKQAKVIKNFGQFDLHKASSLFINCPDISGKVPGFTIFRKALAIVVLPLPFLPKITASLAFSFGKKFSFVFTLKQRP